MTVFSRMTFQTMNTTKLSGDISSCLYVTEDYPHDTNFRIFMIIVPRALIVLISSLGLFSRNQETLKLPLDYLNHVTIELVVNNQENQTY